MNEPSTLNFTLTYAATLGVAALIFLAQVIALTATLVLVGAAGLITYGARRIRRRRSGS